MKKFTLFFILLTAITVYAFSQSLQITDNKGVIIPANSEIIQIGSPDSGQLSTYMYVKNIGTKSLNVLCRKTQFLMLDSTEITMCWAGACYPAKTNLSPNAQLINVGQTITDFVGHYVQVAGKHFKSGESVVRWCFFDKANPTDSVSVRIKYTSFPLGISEPADRQAMLSNVYPNPASAEANFNFELPAGKSGSVIIRDIIGKSVYSENLRGSTGKVVVNTMNFADGVYFCVLLVDEKMVQTRKMIVKH
ncbi:MAG: T9SS type A sorting domain-containing protein [Bacteroidota bacterium]